MTLAKEILVVLDPGHGGRDGGATANGVIEKVYNLATALLLRDELQRAGFRVIMTRDSDELPLGKGAEIGADLAHRARIANDARADLFLSWHADSAADPDARGAAVWIHPAAKGTRTEQRARAIADGISVASGQKNRGVYLGDFQVLRDTAADAVLVEGDFLTNPAAASQLVAPEFQRRQAEGAARAICDIFGVAYVSRSAPTPAPQPERFEDSAVRSVIAALGGKTQTSDEQMDIACNWLANWWRDAKGWEVVQRLGTPSRAAADLLANRILGDDYMATVGDHTAAGDAIRSVIHKSADVLRAKFSV